MDNIQDFLEKQYGLNNAKVEKLDITTNDVYKIISGSDRFALKAYQRKASEILWEIDLLLHLTKYNVPIVSPIKGKDGYLLQLQDEAEIKPCVLFEWATGAKPADGNDIYHRLGNIAAQIHKAADLFSTNYVRPAYDANYLITEQFRRLQPIINQLSIEDEANFLSKKLLNFLENKSLDFGICHMDLKPDNIHIDNNGDITVFDFDSAVKCWRAIEPYRIIGQSRDYFESWLKGYREVRDFGDMDEKAVEIFVIIGELRNAVWHLGYAESSRGEPSMTKDELAKLVEKWEVQIGVIGI